MVFLFGDTYDKWPVLCEKKTTFKKFNIKPDKKFTKTYINFRDAFNNSGSSTSTRLGRRGISQSFKEKINATTAVSAPIRPKEPPPPPPPQSRLSRLVHKISFLSLNLNTYSLYICLQELRIFSFSLVNMTKKLRCFSLIWGVF